MKTCSMLRSLPIAIVIAILLANCTEQRVYYFEPRQNNLKTSYEQIVKRVETNAPKYRRSCGVENYRDITTGKETSFEFINLEMLEKAEDALDTVLISHSIQWEGIAARQFGPQLTKLYKERDKLKSENFLFRNSDRIEDLEETIEYIEFYLKPPSTEEDMQRHYIHSAEWYNDTITKLQNASPVWSDYEALINIEREWLGDLWKFCIGFLPHLATSNPKIFKKITIDEKLVTLREIGGIQQQHWKRIRKEMENTIYRLLQKEGDRIYREIKNIKTERDLDVFFYKYLSASASSSLALKRAGLYEVYEERRNDLWGDPAKPKGKYKN